MDDLTVILTGSGAPGTSGTIYSLKNNFDNRKIKIIGTDIRTETIGKYICDGYYTIPKPINNDYITSLLNICEKENVDVIIPQNTMELELLSRNKTIFKKEGVGIPISNDTSIQLSNNKASLLKTASSIGLPIPKFYVCNNIDSLIRNAQLLGWPENAVVVKPPTSNGMRGVRIIDESVDFKNIFYNEKPSNLYINMNEMIKILGDSFPELMVMEYLPGEEFSVDVLNSNGYTIIPRKRTDIRSGITFFGEIEYNTEIIEQTKQISEVTRLDYAFGFQFKKSIDGIYKLLESNPRIQGTMVLSTFAGANIIYASVKLALEEKIPEFVIEWDTKIIRYWGGIGIHDSKIVGRL